MNRTISYSCCLDVLLVPLPILGPITYLRGHETQATSIIVTILQLVREGPDLVAYRSSIDRGRSRL
jgi:hypothetical protein